MKKSRLARDRYVLRGAERVLYLDTDAIVRGDVDDPGGNASLGDAAETDEASSSPAAARRGGRQPYVALRGDAPRDGRGGAATQPFSERIRDDAAPNNAQVGELATLDMRGAPAAAVEDCTQRVYKYVDFDLLKRHDRRRYAPTSWSRFGLKPEAYSNETCVFNRGVVLFDALRWRELRLTETIEDLVDAFVSTRAKLWRGGISQPPFLLALAGRYLKLDMEWNVRGLGRVDLGRSEWLLLAEYANTRGRRAAPF